MARNTWQCQTKISGSWVSDGTIYRPNTSISLTKTSTQSRAALADGNQAYVTPYIKYRDGDIIFNWVFDDGTTKIKIEGYIDNLTDVKMIDQNSKEYIGRFANITSQWLIGFDGNKYNIRATFIIMPTIA